MQVSQCNQHYFMRATKVSNIVLHNWCYGDCDFTQLHHHLISFRETQQLHGWKDLSMTQLVVNRLNVFWCSHESSVECKHGTLFERTPVMWDTGASLGITLYRAHIFDYVLSQHSSQGCYQEKLCTWYWHCH